MRHIIETGTDVASVCFFDPAALPAEFDERVKQTFLEETKKAGQEGKIWVQDTGADGAYLFHFYIAADLPDFIEKHARDLQEIPQFYIPSGILWACGTEYVARDPSKAGLEKFDHMGGKFELPAGVYGVKVWRTEWSEHTIEREIERRLGKRLPHWVNHVGVMTGLLFVVTFLGTIACGIQTIPLLWRGGWGRDATWFWIGIVGAWLICSLLMWVLKRVEQNPARRAIEREFPSIVVHMQRIQTPTSP